MNRVVKLNVNAVMVNVPVTDVKRASPATAVVNVKETPTLLGDFCVISSMKRLWVK